MGEYIRIDHTIGVVGGEIFMSVSAEMERVYLGLVQTSNTTTFIFTKH